MKRIAVDCDDDRWKHSSVNSGKFRRRILANLEKGLITDISVAITLADPGGAPGARPPPPTPRFGGPSYTVWRPHCKFKSKIMNFGALIFYFFKKFSSLASLGINIICFSHSYSLTLLIISSSYVYTSILYYVYTSTLYLLKP